MDTTGLIYLLNQYLAPITDGVPGELCRNSSILYKEALTLGASWATKMWDSTAKIQTGLLTGNLNSLGNFDECVSIEGIPGYLNFTGRYCMATLKLGNVTSRDALGNMLKQVMDEEGEINIGLGAILAKGLRWGFCIPSSCSSTDLSTGLTDVIGNETGMIASVNDNDCTDNDSKPFSTVDWLAIVALLFFFCASVVGTGYEIYTVYKKYGRIWKMQTPSEYSIVSQMNKTGTTVLTPSPHEQGEMPIPPRPTTLGLSRTSSIVDMQCPGPSLQRPRVLPLTNVNRPATRTPSPVDRIVHDESCSRSYSSTASHISPVESPVRDPPEKEYDILGCFSLVSNCTKMFSFTDSKIILRSIDGLKVLSLWWVVLGHACFITESLPAINFISIRKYVELWPAMIILNTQLAADTFIVCTGTLIAFTFLKDMRKRGIYRRHSNRLDRTGMSKCFLFKYLPAFYLHRYIRFTPALAIIILLQVSLLNHLGSGPFWESGNGYLANVCHESWWGTLLYIENYLAGDRICLPHSWYIMVDYQLYIFSPIILLMFLCWTKRRSLIIVSILVLIGALVSFLVNFLLDLPAGFLRESSIWVKKMKYDYVATHTRMAPWLIGMTLGYLIFNYRRKEILNPTMSKVLICTGWTLTPLLMMYSLFGLAAYQHSSNTPAHNQIWGAMYSGIFHSLWALGVAWIIFTCETNHGGIVQGILSLKIFRPLSHLSYCLYLVHLPLMTYQALTVRVPVHFTGSGGISLFFGDLLVSLLLAILLSLFIEMPMIRLYRAICIHLNVAVRYAPHRPGRKLLAQYAPLIESLRNSASNIDTVADNRRSQPQGSSFMETIRFINQAATSEASKEAESPPENAAGDPSSQNIETKEAGKSVPDPSVASLLTRPLPDPNQAGTSGLSLKKQLDKPSEISEPSSEGIYEKIPQSGSPSSSSDEIYSKIAKKPSES